MWVEIRFGTLAKPQLNIYIISVYCINVLAHMYEMSFSQGARLHIIALTDKKNLCGFV